MTRSQERQILRLAVPALGTLAADPLLSLVDTALVGHLGASQLAAMALAVVAFNLAFIVFNFLAYGTTGPVARLMAGGRSEEAGRYAMQAVWVALGLGLACTVLGELLSRPIAVVLGAEEQVLTFFLQYFRIRLLALTPMLLVMVGHGVFRGLQDTRTPLAVTVGANVVNAGLSALLVYPAGLGVSGAALGTVAAQSMAASAFVVLGRRRLAPLLGEHPWRVDRAVMRGLLSLSRDLMLRTLSLHAVFVFSAAVAIRMDTRIAAAQQIAVELWMFLAMVLDALAIAGQALVGRSLGHGAVAEARSLARTLLRWGIIFGGALGLAYWSLGSVLPRIFTSDPAVLASVALVFPVVALFQPLNAYVFVGDGILIGAEDARYLARSMALSALLAIPVIVAALPLGWGIRGIWAGLSLLMIARAATNGLRLRSGRWLERSGEQRLGPLPEADAPGAAVRPPRSEPGYQSDRV